MSYRGTPLWRWALLAAFAIGMTVLSIVAWDATVLGAIATTGFALMVGVWFALKDKRVTR